ncbi:hypothetical protein Natoc_1544 [Natronococcus occultus SP4]|uniref:Uncharacterized protein n=1 Tax=Natronococcus occultus SP4 TaxID=694430 RepID=L0JX74_9EURY|nr:hypothetical protein Natoc_1544 [Natronococcus occultus SP4]
MPAEYALEIGNLTIPLEPQVIWLMVVAVAGILLANAAMAARNLAIAVGFTVGSGSAVLLIGGGLAATLVVL